MNTNESPVTFTQEEIDYAERSLKAEITKLERAIERQKKEIEDLQPKGFFGGLKNNKEKIREAENQLVKLEDEMIDLQAMTGSDYLRKQLKGKDKKSFFEGINKNMLGKLGTVAEVAGDIIPVPGAGIVGKGVGAVLKGLGKK